MRHSLSLISTLQLPAFALMADTGANATTGSATAADLPEDLGADSDTPGNVVPMNTGSAPAESSAPLVPVGYVNPRDRFPVARTEQVELKTILFDDDLQSRVKIDEATVSEYAEVIKERRKRKEEPGFPAVDLFEDPVTKKRYMVGGFHRGKAHKEAKEKIILANIRLGTKQDALLFAATENTTHGLKRSQKDKQKALKIVLGHPDAKNWSNVEIAKAAGVSEAMVRDHRTVAQSSTTRTVKKKGGKTIQMDVSRIGSKGGKAEKPKASKSNKAPAVPGEKPKPGDGSAPATDAKGRPTLGLNEEGEAALKKIVRALGDKGPGFEEGVRAGALELTQKDIIEFSNSSPERIRHIYPLVADRGMKPKNAYAFIDQDVDENTKVSTLINLAIAGKTALTLPDFNKIKERSTTGFHIKHGKAHILVVIEK